MSQEVQEISSMWNHWSGTEFFLFFNLFRLKIFQVIAAASATISYGPDPMVILLKYKKISYTDPDLYPKFCKNPDGVNSWNPGILGSSGTQRTMQLCV